MINILILVICIFFLLFTLRESFKDLLNIYDLPLESCRSGTMSNGSWDSSGKCSELGGGVHQICVKNIADNTPSFSVETGQSDWSDNRGTDNHCVCLGAWSLYSKKNPDKTDQVLKCDAIPSIAFSKQYVNKFKTWNGNELDGQIVNGVESIYNNCITGNIDKDKKLKDNYCDFASKVPELQNTPSNLYKNICTL